MFGNFTEEARNIIVSAKEEMNNLKHPYIGSEHLLLAILKGKNSISKKLKDYNITYSNVKKEIINIIGVGSKESEWFLYTPMLRRIIENAIVDSKDNNNGEVTINHLFLSLLDEGEGVAIRILLGMGIDIDKLYKDFYVVKVEKKKKNKKLLIEEFGVNLTMKAFEKKLDPVIGREKEITRIIEILMRRCKNNPILVGEAGVGKTAIIEELSTRIANKSVPIELQNKKIISVDMASLVAGTKYRGEFEERLKKMLKEIEEDDDIILFIDEIHTLVGAGGAEGAIDASNIFKPSLARNKFRCIGATTITEYKKYIENDSALERRFQKVIVEPSNEKQTLDILYKIKSIYESYHMVKIDDDILKDIVYYAKKYVYGRNEPDRSIDILDEVCAKAHLKKTKLDEEILQIKNKINNVSIEKQNYILKDNFEKAKELKKIENDYQNKLNELELKKSRKKDLPKVTKEDIAYVISIKTKIPVYEITASNEKMISDFEKKVKKEIIGQDEAINKVIKIARRIKLGFKDDNKCYSYLFSGASGVGKTYLANLFADYLVGKDNIIKLDMSEYKEAHTVSKLVGAPPGYVGYEDVSNVLEEIRNKPNSVLILDEIDKAHPNVINLFFQILEDSKIKDSRGREILFNNVVIIMTTNIGFTQNSIGFLVNSDITRNQKDTFSLAFTNRIDDTILFNPLNENSIRKILSLKLKKIVKKYQSKGIVCKYSSNVINEIINKSSYKEYGARRLDKIIRDDLENLIIEEIINGKKSIKINSLIHIYS